MPRYRLLLEYAGTAFVGWQRQENGSSVQAALEQAVEAFTGEATRLHAAGRTDAGVHAIGQVAHLDLSRDWPARTVREALNAHLRTAGAAVSVLAAAPCPSDFDARHTATGRRYLFRILDRRAPPALDRGRVWHVKAGLDVSAMATAAGALLGRHDFTTFRDAHCQARSPVRTLDQVSVERVGEGVELRFAARSFLHRQVRSMTGTLVEVGLGRWPVGAVAEALAAADRRRCGPVAPPDGLYLTGVDYPPPFEDWPAK